GRGRPARPGPGRSRPGAAVPVPARPAAGRCFGARHGSGVERTAEDVLLAGEGDAVAGDVIRAARELQRAVARRVRELLAEGARLALRGHTGEIDLAFALAVVVAAGELLGVVLDEPLHLVGREARELLQDQRHDTGGEGRGLGRAGAAEVAVVDQALGVAHV